MTTLEDRIREVLAIRPKRVASKRAWSLGAKLSHSQVGSLLTRLADDPAHSPETSTLEALADFAKIRRTWLMVGDGERDVGTVTDLDERYPNRTLAASLARQAKINARAIADVDRDALQSMSDRSVKEWLDAYIARDRQLERFGGVPPGQELDDE